MRFLQLNLTFGTTNQWALVTKGLLFWAALNGGTAVLGQDLQPKTLTDPAQAFGGDAASLSVVPVATPGPLDPLGQVAGSDRQANTSPSTTGNTSRSKEISSRNQQMIAEIEEIRRSLGGGLSEHFDSIGGLFPTEDASGRDLFQQELQNVVANPPTSNGALHKPQNAGGHDENKPSIGNRCKTQTPARLAQLRRCARKLEAVAGVLEQIEAYEDADRVRTQAGALWKKARTDSAAQTVSVE